MNIRSVAQYGEDGLPMGSGCQKALDSFSALARRYGFETENDHDYCVSVLMPGRSGRNELGILGHLDVVPEGPGWQYKPFEALEKNGYIVGRGASDNKGPLMMALYALRCMRELGISPGSDVRLIAGCDEEKEMRDVQHYLKTHQPPAFTLNCDGAWPVCIGEKGILTAELIMPLESSCLTALGGGEASNMVPASAWAALCRADPGKLANALKHPYHPVIEEEAGSVRLYISGKAAHCSAPHTGQNAIRRLLQLLCDCELVAGEDAKKLKILLKALQDDGTGLNLHAADALSGQTTCVCSLLSLQDHTLRLHINVRFPITQSPELLLKRFQHRCELLGLKLENLSISPPRYDSPEQPEIRLLLETCREFLGRRLQPYAAGGGTYSRLFPHSVPFGVGFTGKPLPGVLGGPHAANEAVCINELLQAMKVYVISLMRLDAYFENQAKTGALRFSDISHHTHEMH